MGVLSQKKFEFETKNFHRLAPTFVHGFTSYQYSNRETFIVSGNVYVTQFSFNSLFDEFPSYLDLALAVKNLDWMKEISIQFGRVRYFWQVNYMRDQFDSAPPCIFTCLRKRAREVC